MPKRPTGQLRRLASGWEARIRINTKRRKCFALGTCGPQDEAKAKERTSLLAALALRLRQAGRDDDAPVLLKMIAGRDGRALQDVIDAIDALCQGLVEPLPDPGSSAPTFQELGEEWTSGKLHARWPDHVKDKRSIDSDQFRLAKHVYPIVGTVRVDAFTLDDAERVMRSPTIKPGSRRQVAQLIRRVLGLAVWPCRHMAASPIPKGWLPKARKPKAKTHLWPAEEATVMGCTDIPIAHRMLVGFLAREGMRKSEALGLTWSNLDLDRGVVHLDENKTDDPRAWALAADVAVALRAWARLTPSKSDDPVFPADLRAIDLRAHLRAAGLGRSQLYETSDTRDDFDVHALRGTFVTLALAAGRTETWVTDRTGHQSSQMVHRYKRAARTAGELELGWLRPLHEVVPEVVRATNGPQSSGGFEGVGQLAEAFTNDSDQCAREDSNLHTLRYWILNPARLPIPPLALGGKAS
jgi:integrase